jgi:hypothetical protein
MQMHHEGYCESSMKSRGEIKEMPSPSLYALPEAARLLGDISIWTLRKHVACDNVSVVHLGKRVFLASEEIERIRREGLPSLRNESRSVSHSEVNSNSNTKELDHA